MSSQVNQAVPLDPLTKKHLDLWLESNIDEKTKEEIRQKLKTTPQELVDAFYTHLTFGTGGLRGIMGIGTNRMNQYTVQMATQGLANYITQRPPHNDHHSVFIGYDSRHHSRFFAEESAKVLAANGIHVYLCKELRPTPFISFGCRYHQCTAAIMITASHNPPSYNGYKVYWKDGGQIVPPHDKGIIEEVKKITDPSKVLTAQEINHPLITEVGSELDQAYLNAVKGNQFFPEENRSFGNELKVVYTSLHGTGTTLLPQTLEQWGFTNIILVEGQTTPDGDFPTVKSPNPEERSALELGIQTLQKEKADLLIATDPDADRVGVAIMHAGEVRVLNGNQIACLCLYHICEALKAGKGMPEKAAFVKTIATTELFRAITEAYGGACFDTLTGFKYIAELIEKWKNDPNGYRYIFGGEESYGYLLGTEARDKDAITSAALICEVALHAKRQGKTLIDVLHEIYQKFGVYLEKLSAIKFPETKVGREKMANAMEILHNNPPKSLLGVNVISIENYQTSMKIDIKSGKNEPLTLPKSNVLCFWLEDGTKLMIRPSGTEPKVKIYCGVMEKNFSDVSTTLKACKKKAEDYITAMTQQLEAN